MKKNFVLIVMILVSVTLFSRDRKFDDKLSLKSSYILPIEQTDFNSSLVVGLGFDFWGIFEFTGSAYLEIDRTKSQFSEVFQSPDIFSAGIGMNIPFGGFYLKTDAQRFFSVSNRSSVLSLSSYVNSYKLGVGLELSDSVELEFYHRTLTNNDIDIINGKKQQLIGAGVIVKI